MKSNNNDVKKVLTIRKLKKAISIGKEFIDTAISISNDAKPLNIAKEGVKHLSSYIDKKSEDMLYSGTIWKRWYACPTEIVKFIVDLASEDSVPVIVEKTELTSTIKIISIHGTNFRISDDTWIHKPSNLTDEQASHIIGRMILEKVGTRCEYSSSGSKKGRSRDSSSHKIIAAPITDIFTSEKAVELADRIKPYIAKRINRSIFLHGPPGTGKTCLVEYLAREVGGVYLTFGPAQLETLTTAQLQFAISSLCPDVLVINDIDRALYTTSAELLKVLEEFNNHIKLIAVTSNSLELPPAALRPGRFDEVKRIDTLGIEAVRHMLEGYGDAVVDKVKDWPAAFIHELKTRLDVGGLDSLEQEFSDLGERVKLNSTGLKC